MHRRRRTLAAISVSRGGIVDTIGYDTTRYDTIRYDTIQEVGLLYRTETKKLKVENGNQK